MHFNARLDVKSWQSHWVQNLGQKYVKDNYYARFEFVCFEVLRPSQPNGVMPSAVSLTNHTFTGQA